ncbi:MAG: hypothetical protein R2706_07215 [Acidimicrobiales bacterium]
MYQTITLGALVGEQRSFELGAAIENILIEFGQASRALLSQAGRQRILLGPCGGKQGVGLVAGSTNDHGGLVLRPRNQSAGLLVGVADRRVGGALGQQKRVAQRFVVFVIDGGGGRGRRRLGCFARRGEGWASSAKAGAGSAKRGATRGLGGGRAGPSYLGLCVTQAGNGGGGAPFGGDGSLFGHAKAAL